MRVESSSPFSLRAIGTAIRPKAQAPVDSTEGTAEATAPVDRVTTSSEDAELEKPGELSEGELQLVDALRKRDVEVRAHEAAHAAAGGALAGAASFSYQRGPDGKSYAVGGEVSVDLSPGRTPAETIARAQRVRAAATAPAQPSAQDLQVASKAMAMEMEARLEQLQTALPSRETSDLSSTHFHLADGCPVCAAKTQMYASSSQPAAAARINVAT